ncbi:hypothetical protein ACE01N_13285 [Saccharicrinis sp. FJH2]|uniref:hypothetical protein n=1 Tax=Saccharicrinis sp. FJH65 TaxID=3344659 RepID=UPI0035F3C872
MQENSTYSVEYNVKNKIFYKRYSGTVQLENIFESWQNIFRKSLIPEDVKGFILDYRLAHFAFNLNEYHQIPEFYKDNLEYFYEKKIAILTNNPHDVVVTTLVKTMDDGYQSKPFSSEEAALHWILNQ